MQVVVVVTLPNIVAGILVFVCSEIFDGYAKWKNRLLLLSLTSISPVNIAEFVFSPELIDKGLPSAVSVPPIAVEVFDDALPCTARIWSPASQ